MLPLRLTDEDPTLKLHPDTLFQHLEKSLHNLDDLVKELRCTPEDLQETLAAEETSHALRHKTQLACLQVQLLAIRYAPHAMTRLLALTNNTEKPEVARRAANTILHLAGIATNTAAQPPAPAPIPAPPPPEEEEPDSEHIIPLRRAVAFVMRLKRKDLDLSELDDSKESALIEILRPFLHQSPPTPA